MADKHKNNFKLLNDAIQNTKISSVGAPKKLLLSIGIEIDGAQNEIFNLYDGENVNSTIEKFVKTHSFNHFDIPLIKEKIYQAIHEYTNLSCPLYEGHNDPSNIVDSDIESNESHQLPVQVVEQGLLPHQKYLLAENAKSKEASAIQIDAKVVPQAGAWDRIYQHCINKKITEIKHRNESAANKVRVHHKDQRSSRPLQNYLKNSNSHRKSMQKEILQKVLSASCVSPIEKGQTKSKLCSSLIHPSNQSNSIIIEENSVIQKEGVSNSSRRKAKSTVPMAKIHAIECSKVQNEVSQGSTNISTNKSPNPSKKSVFNRLYRKQSAIITHQMSSQGGENMLTNKESNIIVSSKRKKIFLDIFVKNNTNDKIDIDSLSQNSNHLIRKS